MSTFADEILAVVQGVIQKTIGDAEAAVNEIQTQLLALTALTDEQRAVIRQATEIPSQGVATMLLQKLGELMKSNSDLAEVLMPIIMSLQFQDRLRQELESLHKTLGLALPHVAADNGRTIGILNEEFWKDAAKTFTNIQSREVVMKAVFGPEYVNPESDVREAASDDGFFF